MQRAGRGPCRLREGEPAVRSRRGLEPPAGAARGPAPQARRCPGYGRNAAHLYCLWRPVRSRAADCRPAPWVRGSWREACAPFLGAGGLGSRPASRGRGGEARAPPGARGCHVLRGRGGGAPSGARSRVAPPPPLGLGAVGAGTARRGGGRRRDPGGLCSGPHLGDGSPSFTGRCAGHVAGLTLGGLQCRPPGARRQSARSPRPACRAGAYPWLLLGGTGGRGRPRRQPLSRSEQTSLFFFFLKMTNVLRFHLGP